MQAAQACRARGELEAAFSHLERAHILGQRHTWLHMRSHFGMWRIGWMRRDLRELFGQSTRVVAAMLFSKIWVPLGNTGGANVSAMLPMPVPAELQVILDADA